MSIGPCQEPTPVFVRLCRHEYLRHAISFAARVVHSIKVQQIVERAYCGSLGSLFVALSAQL